MHWNGRRIFLRFLWAYKHSCQRIKGENLKEIWIFKLWFIDPVTEVLEIVVHINEHSKFNHEWMRTWACMSLCCYAALLLDGWEWEDGNLYLNLMMRTFFFYSHNAHVEFNKYSSTQHKKHNNACCNIRIEQPSRWTLRKGQ